MRMRNTAIMAVALVIMGALVYFLEIRGAEERAAEEAVAARLLSFETDDVTSMTIETAEETITLARVDEAWRITAPYDLAADEAAANAIVNRLQSADHERVIDEAPDDLGRFGLDNPELSVTLQLADGGTRSIDFGGSTPVGLDIFVRTGEGETVYTAAGSIKDAANKTLFDLRDRGILSFTQDEVTRLAIEGPGDVTVERQPDLGDGIDRWALSAPLEARADADSVGALLRRWSSGNAVSFAADEPTDEQIAEFGLDDPEITLRLSTADDTAQTLHIGGTSEEPAGRYARREGSRAVMVIPDGIVNELPESADDLRNRAVVEFARDRVRSIEITTDEPPLRVEKDGVDWRVTAPRPLDGDAATASSLLTAALDLRAREFPTGTAADARFGFDAPHARVAFELEELPGQDAGIGTPAETVTLIIGAATEVAADEEPGASPDETDTEGDEATPANVAARYVSVDGDPTVYTVAEEDLEDIEADLFALRSKTLVSFAQSDLTRIEVIADDATTELTRNEDGAWSVGGEAVPDDDTGAIDDLLWRLNYLDMHGIVAESGAAAAADLAAYGLADPELRVRAYVDAERVADVALGAEVPDDQLGDDPAPFATPAQTYATVGDGGDVYRVDAALRDAARALLEALSA